MHTIDGNLGDWTSSNVLNPAGTTAAGYSLYGDLSGGTLSFAIQAPIGTSISTYTTIWLNTDKNTTTGYNIWGLYGGYDYNINVAADGKPYLYTGADGQTLVSTTPLTYAYNADHTVLELSLSAAQVGTPKSLNVLADVNNSVFLPGDYGAGPYTLTDASSLPARTYTGHKVGIVYSDSTAANYFSTMAYSQLFMAVQNQAAAAGVPYDLLSESDLTDLSKLSNYDELIFPSFRNVSAAKVGAITDTLTALEKNYHVGIITAGDFMTNDEKNAPLSGDSYARMKALLDVSRVDGVNGVNVDVTAATTTNPVMTGYTAGESIHQYTNISTSYFTSTDGLGTTLANQTVNGQSHIAVMATQTGGKNVHFATDGMLADNNMLGHALDWTMAPATGPDVSLHMSRDKAIVAARVDMDQAMYTDDVHPATGQGIYDKLLPILAQWKSAYNFVGSYYIDIGNDSANGESTDWTFSKKYYNQMLAMGNEIGSHSVTHPEDTNVLTPAQFQAEFQQSRSTIEQQLGLTNIGAAIPGAGENLATARQIEQYYPYITGGGSLIGAGYPGAIGYLSPAAADMKSVYIAPNTSFDFTLVGYQHLTAAQAEAAWAKEWGTLTAHSDLPVVVWPWHDYGPTDWLTDTTDSGYTQQMFTDFIARAAQAGSEFVTLNDLAQRSATFEKSDVSYSFDAASSVLTASATTASGDLGKFALDVGTSHTIKNVAGWYAYDSNSVFVPKAGGTFTIALDGTPDDVTHLTTLADRSDLLSVTGDGSNLSYSVIGEGHDIVQLKAHPGQLVQITGVDAASLTGANLDLSLVGLGQHDVSVILSASPVGTAASNTIIGTDTADIVNGGAGADTLQGLAGNDTYIVDNVGDKVVEAANAGIDTVQSSVSYTLSANVENLVLTGSAAINGTGNALANVITGNSAANTLSGGDGADILEGKAGNDSLTGGLGADVFIFNKAGQGIDTVKDFSTAQGDKLEVHAPDYTLPIGALASDFFETNTTGIATKSHAEFIFNSGTHILSWDADGLGHTAGISIANFSNSALLHYQDITIIA